MQLGLARTSLALTFWIMVTAATAQAALPADTLLPDTTRGFASVPSVAALEEQFGKTQLGKLADDPAMKPFSNDLKRQFDEKLANGYQRLGLQWEDIRAMASGEVAVATVHDAKTPAGTAVILDIAGRGDAAKTHLEQVFARLKAESFTQKTETIDGTALEIFDRAAVDEEPARQVVYFLKDDLLCCTDQLELSHQLLKRFVEKPSNNLAGTEAYRYVMDRCQQEAANAAPQLRWFIEPLAYAEAVRQELPPRKSADAPAATPKKQDTLLIMKVQGFEGLRGVGGYVQFFPQDGKYEVLHHTAIYAPQPYELAMRAVKLPNVATFTPPTWATKHLARWSSISVDLQNAFEMSSTLYDQIVGRQGAFKGMLDSVKNDVNGPRIDLENDLVKRLDPHVTVVVDYQAPAGDESGERRVIAIPSNDPQALKVAIDKWMKAEVAATKNEVGDVTVWEISQDNAGKAPPVVNGPPRVGAPRIGPPKIGPKPVQPPQDGNNAKLVQKSAVAVVHGHLFVASHADALMEIVKNPTPPAQLTDDAEYQEVMKQLAEVSPGQGCAKVFTRTSEARRVSYELLKEGKLRQSDTLFARIINVILGEKPAASEPPKVQGDDLPAFDKIARYFGPAGTSFRSEEKGFIAVGILLKQPASAEGEVARTPGGLN